MSERKRPRKKDSGRDDEVQPRTEEKADLVPAPHHRPRLFALQQMVRGAVGALMDWADAAAGAINKTLERRA